MPRLRWPVIIALEIVGCIALVAGGLLLYAASPTAGLPTQAVPPTHAPVTATSEAAYVTFEPLPTLTPAGSAGPNDLTPAAPTALPDSYTVVDGDTLWGIAVQFNLDIETLIAANPGLNPDLLLPGDRIALQAPPSAAREATPAASNARVSEGGGGLRLRQGPGLSQPIITLLDAGTALDLIGRTEDRGWLQVIVPAWGQGWVMARYVDTSVALDAVPVTGQTLAAPTAAVDPAALPPPPGEAAAHPYMANVTDRARQIFQFGLSLGNRPGVFSKVGDSITVSGAFLNSIGYGNYNLREYGALQPVIDFYSPALARDANSFANTTLAAKVGWPAQAVLSPKAADLNYCAEGEAPLVCEYRWVRPSVALIMLGTNDVPGTSGERFERHMREVIEISTEMGVVPIVSTIPPLHRAGTEGRVELLNGILTRLALEYGVPLWDYHSALQGLPDDGLIGDGVHPSVGPHSADFTPENLQYGMTVRNLTALQALDAVWRFVSQ